MTDTTMSTTSAGTTAQLVQTLADVPTGAVSGAVSDALAVADLVELRLDRLPAGALQRVGIHQRPRVVATCRAAWEGGGWTGTESSRLDLLCAALDIGVGYVDIEWRAEQRHRLLERDRTRVVLSLHDFDETPTSLECLLDAMAGERPAVVKVAVQARRMADIGRLADAGARIAPQPAVLIAMGASGIPSRVLAGRLGSCWTYAGAGVAPGQLPAETMRTLYRVGSLTSRTAVYGVAGRPVGHSLSPVLHNAALAELGADAVYVPCEPADFADLLESAAYLGLRGLSVTAPFKADALACAIHADEATRAIGAANTLTRHPAGWVATNTDVDGFLAPLLALRPVAGVRAAILGAGGAARAVVAGLRREGAVVTVYARRPEQAAALETLGAQAGQWPPPRGSWDLLVNTTPVGTSPAVEDTPLDPALLGPGLVYDLVYNPAQTRLLRDARAAGAITIGGLDMLLGQAAQQFALWFDVPPPLDSMRRAVARYAPHLLA
jgi:3-dehydroquinate dehydratase/shikimate dehydrogenase